MAKQTASLFVRWPVASIRDPLAAIVGAVCNTQCAPHCHLNVQTFDDMHPTETCSYIHDPFENDKVTMKWSGGLTNMLEMARKYADFKSLPQDQPTLSAILFEMHKNAAPIFTKEHEVALASAYPVRYSAPYGCGVVPLHFYQGDLVAVEVLEVKHCSVQCSVLRLHFPCKCSTELYEQTCNAALFAAEQFDVWHPPMARFY